MSDIDDIRDYLVKKEPLIAREIEKIIPTDGPKNLYDAMRYHLDLGGKKIRPGLCLLVAERLGLKLEKILPFAAGLELIHAFSLIHDDIQDQDQLRRGQPAVWVKYGIPHAINIGDGIFTKVFESVLRCSLPADQIVRLVGMIATASITIIEGQAIDMNFRNRSDVTEGEYMDMIWRKTGILFGTALSGPAFVAKASAENLKALLEYGKLIGPAFQIRDDVIDLDAEANKGRELGADIKEGKRSLVVIHALGKVGEKKKLLDILNKPKGQTTERDIEWAINLLKASGSIEYAMKKAEETAEKAKRKLEILDNHRLKKDLSTLCDYIVHRKN